MTLNRVFPQSFGPSPIRPWTFVARKTFSRFPPASARAVISSLLSRP